ncbi:tetratricopeptide repeat protein, partial [bacterium]|nr:tetratricopeptide repeat protein [bacterium]
MREFDQVSNLFKELEKLFEGEGEYLSHQTALFFLGQIQDVPKTLTAVSPRRRRIREIGEHTLVFVFHPKQKVKQTQSVSIGETSLPVSNLEKTLLDLLTDIQYSPPIETLANFFSSFPYNPIALLDLAKTTSDTVLKRASFFLAWSGRVSYQNLFISHLTRTPIQLDPRMKNFDSIWDNRFHTRYPSKILSVSVISGPQNLGFETASWKELRAHPQILKTMGENSFLFIRDEPSSLQKKLLEGVFKLLLENTGDAEIETFLLGYPKNGFEEGKSPKHYPFLFYQWLDCQQSFPNSHFDLISSWVRSNVYSNDLGKLETALFWGNKLRLYQLIIESLSKNGNRIFSSGKIRVLSSISVALTKSHHPLPFTIYVLAARCLANENRPKDGLKILAGAKKFFEEQDHSEIECGEISYATGNILRGINRLDASVAELYLAREYFEQAGDQRRIAMVDSGLGNLFFACGRNREARAKYLSALSVMRSVGERSAQATLLGSLGLVEYECGRLRRAEQLFGRSQRLHEVLGNSWNQSRIAMSQAKSFLTMGFFAKAKKLFQECYKIKTEQNHLGGMYESASFMAWISVVLGSSAAAKAWWDTIPDGEVKDDFEEPRVLLVFRYLKAMTELFLGNFFLAQSWYQKLYSAVNAQDSTNVAKGNVLHGMGVCQAFQGNSSAPQVLRKAID